MFSFKSLQRAGEGEQGLHLAMHACAQPLLVPEKQQKLLAVDAAIAVYIVLEEGILKVATEAFVLLVAGQGTVLAGAGDTAPLHAGGEQGLGGSYSMQMCQRASWTQNHILRRLETGRGPEVACLNASLCQHTRISMANTPEREMSFWPIASRVALSTWSLMLANLT